MPVAIPPSLLRHPERADWLARLPRLVDELLDEWGLRVDGESMAGHVALVVPVRTVDGEPAALKASWPHWEAETEHLALRYWAGDGAVRLLRADPRRFALLLERADGARDLHALPVHDAIEVVAGLYPRLHRTPPPQLRTLSSLATDWSRRLPLLIAHGGVPRRLVEHAVGLARDFGADAATDGALIHSDLHYGNVLASLRGDGDPWLVIDPKPLSGDPAYEVGPLLGNRWDELPADRLRDGLLDRVLTAADAAGLDEDRVRDWAFVRAIVDVLWDVEDGAVAAERLDRCITIAKAMQR